MKAINAARLPESSFFKEIKWLEIGMLTRIEIERAFNWTARVRSLIPQIEQILQKNDAL